MSRFGRSMAVFPGGPMPSGENILTQAHEYVDAAFGVSSVDIDIEEMR